MNRYGEIFSINPEAIIQVNAEPGVGKTTLFYNLCLYGAMGKEWLGIPFSKTIKSLYIDVETPKRKRKHKLRAICEEEALPKDFYLLDWLDLKEDFHKLLSLCKRERYDVVVLDTQSRIFGMERENDNSEANQLMGLLRKLANETGCCIVLIHHTTKGDDSKGVYRGRGASAVAGAVDIVVNMECLDDEVIKITVPKNRIVGTNPVLYLKKAGEDRFEPYTPPEGSSGFELFKAQDFINTLPDDRTYQTDEIYQLGRDKGFSESTTKRALSRLVESGKWERVKKGVYRKVGTGHGSKSSGIYPDPIDPLTRSQHFSMNMPSYLE